MTRVGLQERATAETTIRVRIDLDGTGRAEVETPIGFLDHLLTLVARHALVDLEVTASGDVHIDEHHTVEDTALVLGRAIDEALGDRSGIRRYGDVRLPMDEALALCAVDLGGRGYSDVAPVPDPLTAASVWLELWPHFVETLAREARAAVHLEVRGARSTHHLVEGGAKALSRALRQAWEADPRLADTVPSSKGTLR
ncbi:MAG TPA: imidazoleglycerol-phosphate dehydratase [Candidatus Angelobacter sp.]|nr:imidazoleglycerol-phosphate dehydratase [Candidatus Angelobacter sp.]